jgi:hypothetical protein
MASNIGVINQMRADVGKSIKRSFMFTECFIISGPQMGIGQVGSGITSRDLTCSWAPRSPILTDIGLDSFLAPGIAMG